MVFSYDFFLISVVSVVIFLFISYFVNLGPLSFPLGEPGKRFGDSVYLLNRFCIDFQKVCFISSFISKYFLISSLILLLTNCSFNCILLNFNIFILHPFFFLQLISSFIPLWSENTLEIISIPLNLLRLVL